MFLPDLNAILDESGADANSIGAQSVVTNNSNGDADSLRILYNIYIINQHILLTWADLKLLTTDWVEEME